MGPSSFLENMLLVSKNPIISKLLESAEAVPYLQQKGGIREFSKEYAEVMSKSHISGPGIYTDLLPLYKVLAAARGLPPCRFSFAWPKTAHPGFQPDKPFDCRRTFCIVNAINSKDL